MGRRDWCFSISYRRRGTTHALYSMNTRGNTYRCICNIFSFRKLSFFQFTFYSRASSNAGSAHARTSNTFTSLDVEIFSFVAQGMYTHYVNRQTYMTRPITNTILIGNTADIWSFLLGVPNVLRKWINSLCLSDEYNKKSIAKKAIKRKCVWKKMNFDYFLLSRDEFAEIEKSKVNTLNL